MAETPSSERLRLRYVTKADLPGLEPALAHEAGGFNDFGGGSRPIADDAWTDGELRNDKRAVLLIERRSDGAPLGSIQYNRMGYGPNPESYAWMIGIEVLPDARGQGYGTEAQRLLADWLFTTTSAYRVEASTDVENLAEAHSLEKAGFTREGVARRAQFRAGTYHDLVMFSRLRDDPT
jgi:RimJ/RimL family protein N-acetyltransferase